MLLNYSIRYGIVAAMLSTTIVRADNQLKVPPADELLVIDPRVDSEKKPTPVFLDNGTGTAIQIPPTVVVHRYYYSGNRDFQGPMLPGGPSVIVASHPVTGEQVSLNVQLMPGAPRIKYTKHAITYDYGDRCISIDFGLASFCDPKVIYHRDSGIRHQLSQARQRTSGVVSGFVSRARIPESIQWWRKKNSDAVLSLGDQIGDLKKQTADTAGAVIERTPLSGILQPRPAGQAPGLGALEQTGIVQELQNSIPTNR